MKTYLLIIVAIFAINPLFGGNESSPKDKAAKKSTCEQRKKEENAKYAKKYQERAQKLLDSKLNKCFDKASGQLKTTAMEEVELQKNLGELYQNLSNAYKNGDKDAIKIITEKKGQLNEALDLAHRKTKMEKYKSNIQDKLKNNPDSQELKDLSNKISTLTEKYLNTSIAIVAKKKEREELQKTIKELNNEASKIAHSAKKKREH